MVIVIIATITIILSIVGVLNYEKTSITPAAMQNATVTKLEETAKPAQKIQKPAEKKSVQKQKVKEQKVEEPKAIEENVTQNNSQKEEPAVVDNLDIMQIPKKFKHVHSWSTLWKKINFGDEKKTEPSAVKVEKKKPIARDASSAPVYTK